MDDSIGKRLSPIGTGATVDSKPDLDQPPTTAASTATTETGGTGTAKQIADRVVSQPQGTELVGEGRKSGTATGPAPVTPAGRPPDELFDYVVDTRLPTLERSGYFGGILRGATYQPVFGEGGNWQTRGLSGAGNWILDSIADAGSDALHSTLKKGVKVPVTEHLVAGFRASGRKIREDELPIGDMRRFAIADLRSKHPGALSLWIEGNFGQSLGFHIGHSIPVGTSGIMVNFGFSAEEALDFTMQRLLFVPARGEDIPAAAEQVARLALSPMRAESVAKMEVGATYRFAGHANLRMDASLGFGVSVPALNNLIKIGARVEIGVFASLTGDFSMEMRRIEAGMVRLTLTSVGSASAGAQLKIFAGVQVNHRQVTRLLRGFVDFVADGGDPVAFHNQLSNERERELAKDMSGYLRLLIKNLADGVGNDIIDYLVTEYAAAYLEARGGIDIASNFSTEIDFDLEAEGFVVLPRADMVPESMRGGATPDTAIRVKAGALARLAYDMAIHGDLRLVQQLTLIRGSGVRVNERTTRDITGTSSDFKFKLPFLEYRSAESTTHTLVDRFTPELGRTRSSIWAFTREYRGLFGNTQNASAEVRVHTPDGKSNAEVFFASDENFSADFVVQNMIEPWTSYSDMQDFVGVLNVLSNGRLEDRVREALGTGQYRDDDVGDDLNIIHQLFFKPREYGRTIVHLHVWLSETGLRHLLAGDLSEDQLYAAIGKVFANLDPEGGTDLHDWAQPDARGSLETGRRRPGHSRAGDDEVGPWDHDLETARYLVDNIMQLRGAIRAARTPAQEDRVAADIRDFLRDTKEKLPAYAALASLVPEQHRAVEMRLSAIRKGATPIRFTFIQDGRASDLLYATGYARMAMRQYKRYAGVLDVETRLRIGNLLGEMHDVLNAPSPDPYRLEVAMRALRSEMVRLDMRSSEMAGRIEEDIRRGRAFLDGVPDARTIQAVLPGPLGTELATIRLNTLRLLNSPQSDVRMVRASFKELLDRMPHYRRVASVSELVASTARLTNALFDSQRREDKRLVRDAQKAIEHLRAAIREQADDATL
ncbi:MAG: hypothetical protein V3T05_10015, partial [Myxococcota bacterium]